MSSISGRTVTAIPFGAETREARPVVSLSLSRPLTEGEVVELALDGLLARTLATGSTLAFEERRLETGLHTYTARLVDSAGRTTPLDLNGTLGGTSYSFRVV